MKMKKFGQGAHLRNLSTEHTILPNVPELHEIEKILVRGEEHLGTSCRVATAQGKQGIWFLLFPDRENTGNFALTQGKILRHRENIFL